MNTGLALTLTFFLLAANAFFVAGEFAVTSSRHSAIEPLAKNGKRGAKQALYALQHVSLMLAVSQLGITVMSTSLGVIAEPAIAGILEVPLTAVGVSMPVVHVTSFVVALALVLFLHVVFGEMVPKNISIARSTQALLLLAPPLVGLGRLFGPIVRFLDAVANWFISHLGMEPKSEIAAAFTTQEVAAIVDASREAGKLEDELGFLSGTLEFGNKTVADVMVPVDQSQSLSAPVTPEDVEALVAKTGFSRFPVKGKDGRVLGYVHLKDALYAPPERRGAPLESWRVRPLKTIDADTPIDDALREMQASSVHVMGVGEGSPVGLVFLEDLLEELVGQVRDASQRGGPASR